MKYCTHCGQPVLEEAAVCVHCGCSVNDAKQQTVASRDDDVMKTVIKVFLIIGCISVGWALIPLAWCIPITVSIFRKLDAGEPIGTGLKVVALIFVNLVAGICLLCTDN